MGWPLMSTAQPNPAHRALKELVALGKIETLITQNVDSLHEQAGLTAVEHLHGDLRAGDLLGLRCIRASNPITSQARQTQYPSGP